MAEPPTGAGTREVLGPGLREPVAEVRGASARRWGARLGKAALLVVITWALYRSLGLNLAELNREDLARWRPATAPLLGSAALLIAVYLMHALLWRRIVGDLIGERLGIATALRIYFLANLGRYLPGRIWQVAGMAVLARGAGVPPLSAIAASALAQLCFLLTGTLFLTALMPLALGTGTNIAIIVACTTLVGGVGWVLASTGGERLRKRLRVHLGARFGTRVGTRLGARLGLRLTEALDAVGRIRARDGLVWLGGYTLSWVLLCAAFATFTIAFVPAAATEFSHLAGTMAAGYLSGYLAIFAPAGVGVREGVMGVLLARVIPAQAALLVSVASRIWFTITELLVLLAIPFLRRSAPAPGGYDARQETRSSD